MQTSDVAAPVLHMVKRNSGPDQNAVSKASYGDMAELLRILLLQVLFLLYHYFAAAEMYNAIRVYIAAYVWMTGFGNFLYYYKTNDFSLPRCDSRALP